MRRAGIVGAVAAAYIAIASATGCTKSEGSKTAMFEEPQDDIAMLGKFITLQPKPVEARWSITTLGADDVAIPGPSDQRLWAVLRYSASDFATISRALEKEPALSPDSAEQPAWLAAEADAGARNGRASAGAPFASRQYFTGYAQLLPDNRVLVHFATQ